MQAGRAAGVDEREEYEVGVRGGWRQDRARHRTLGTRARMCLTVSPLTTSTRPKQIPASTKPLTTQRLYIVYMVWLHPLHDDTNFIISAHINIAWLSRLPCNILCMSLAQWKQPSCQETRECVLIA